MKEKDYHMDDDLSQFELDLKSLTPKHFPASLPLQMILPVQSVGLASQADAGEARDQQPQSARTSNSKWFKTVAVSWATGLAAGLLVSAIWSKLMKEETSVMPPNLLTEYSSVAGGTEQTEPLSVSQNSSSRTTTHQQSLSAHSLSTQPGTDFVGNTRRTTLSSSDQQILHPFMALNNVNWNAAMLPSSKRFAGVQSENKPASEQANAPDSATGNSQKSIPVSIPKTQGQRELLKSLMESDDLISI